MALGPTTPVRFLVLVLLWTGNGRGRGGFKILDVAMMQSQGSFEQEGGAPAGKITVTVPEKVRNTGTGMRLGACSMWEVCAQFYRIRDERRRGEPELDDFACMLSAALLRILWWSLNRAPSISQE